MPRHWAGEPNQGSARCGPICFTSEQTVSPLRQLETGPLCHCLRCSPDSLGIHEGIHVSTLFPDIGRCLQKSRAEGLTSVIGTNLANPALVPNSVGEVLQLGLGVKAIVAQQYQGSLQHRTINAVKSAISMIMKASPHCVNCRPPVPRYTTSGMCVQ